VWSRVKQSAMQGLQCSVELGAVAAGENGGCQPLRCLLSNTSGSMSVGSGLVGRMCLLGECKA
jgi:hypothetical protein